MLPWAWDPQRWTDQMMYLGWLLVVVVGIAAALLILAAVVGTLARISDEASSTVNPDQKSRVHVSQRQQRKSADV